MRRMWQSICRKLKTKEASACSHRRKAISGKYHFILGHSSIANVWVLNCPVEWLILCRSMIHNKIASLFALWSRSYLCKIMGFNYSVVFTTSKTTSVTCLYCLPVHVWGMWKAVFVGFQLKNPRANPHWWSAVCLSLWWVQQEVCPVDESEVSYTDTCKTKVRQHINWDSLIDMQAWLYFAKSGTCINNVILCLSVVGINHSINCSKSQRKYQNVKSIEITNILIVHYWSVDARYLHILKDV
jgi:hypothetical protein